MLATLSWWLVIQLIGVVALPLSWRLFAQLPGRGYAFARPVGLLLVSFVLWLGATFQLLPNDPGGVAVALLIVAGVSAWIGRPGLRRDPEGDERGWPLWAWLRANRRMVLVTEGLFLLFFVGWTVFRAYNPEIAGTEKPMELAFINGVAGSRFFPPQDPWLSGYAISYYYFGYVMLDVLIKLTGVEPAIAFNLGLALWYAMVATGAFAIVHDLVLHGQAGAGVPPDGVQARSGGRAIRYGLLGTLFVGVMGNLEGLVELAYHKSLLPLSFFQWLDIKQLTEQTPSGGLTGGYYWWWRASRVIHDRDLLGNSVELIDEFPFFSFLLGDMHPHVLGLPFVLVAIGLALNLLLGSAGVRAASGASGEDGGGPRHFVRTAFARLGELTGAGAAGVVIVAILIGGTSFLNTWDFPIYLALTALAIGIGTALRGESLGRAAVTAAVSAIILGVIGWLAYLPYYLGLQSQLGGVLPNLLFPSRFSQYFTLFGPLLATAALLLFVVGRTLPARDTVLSVVKALLWVLLLPAALIGLIGLAFVALPAGRDLLQHLLSDPGVQANVAGRSAGDLLRLVLQIRIANPWTTLVVGVLVAGAAGVLWASLHRQRQESQHPVSAADLFAVGMVGLAALLTYGVEFVYLRDLFGSRMNTVFKLYYQAWILYALGGAYGLSRFLSSREPAALRAAGGVVVGALVLGCLYYPIAAIPTKADMFRGSPTLDGLAHLESYNAADLKAIRWIRENVPPDAVVLEATGGSYSQEGAGRVSMATGNPTLLGWDFHEMQWRGRENYDRLAGGRGEAITRIYRAASKEELGALLEQWDVDFVYIGALERSKYGVGEATLDRFDRAMRLVYDDSGVRIYAR